MTSHYLNQFWPSSLTHICSARGRSVNSLAPVKFEWKFKSVTFKQILMIYGWGISCDLTDDWSILIKVMGLAPGLGSNTFFQIQIQIQIQVFRFFKYKYKYKYDEIFFSNTNTNTNTNIKIQIQIQIRLRFYSNTNIGIQIQIRFFTLYTTINISPNFSKMPLSDPETDPMLEYC